MSTRKTTAERDRITNAIIRKLTTDHLREITKYINEELWEKGQVQSSRKHAGIFTIPKDEKPPAIESLLPISLTSCLESSMKELPT